MKMQPKLMLTASLPRMLSRRPSKMNVPSSSAASSSVRPTSSAGTNSRAISMQPRLNCRTFVLVPGIMPEQTMTSGISMTMIPKPLLSGDSTQAKMPNLPVTGQRKLSISPRPSVTTPSLRGFTMPESTAFPLMATRWNGTCTGHFSTARSRTARIIS